MGKFINGLCEWASSCYRCPIASIRCIRKCGRCNLPPAGGKLHRHFHSSLPGSRYPMHQKCGRCNLSPAGGKLYRHFHPSVLTSKSAHSQACPLANLAIRELAHQLTCRGRVGVGVLRYLFPLQYGWFWSVELMVPNSNGQRIVSPMSGWVARAPPHPLLFLSSFGPP